MTVLQELLVKFTGDTSGLNKALSGAGKAVAVFSKTAALAQGVLSSAFIALGIRSAKLIDAQKDLAASLGITYTALENMALVAGEAGVSQETLAQSIGLMQRNLVEAASGSGAAAAAFAALGLSAQGILTLAPEEQFASIAEGLNGVENPALKTALAMDIFGRSGRNLIPMLDDFSAASANAKEFNDRFGLSLTAIDTAKVDAAGDAMGRVGKIVEGVGNTVAVYSAPAVEQLANQIINLAPTAQTTGKVVSVVMGVLIKGAQGLEVGIRAIGLGYDYLALKAVEFSATFMKTVAQAQIGIENFVRDTTGKSIKLADSAVNSYANLQGKAKAMAEQLAVSSASAQAVVKAQGAGMAAIAAGGNVKPPSGYNAASEGVDKITKSYKGLKDEANETNKTLVKGLQDFATEIENGGNAMDALRKIALDTIRDIINNIAGVSGGGGGGGLGSILGGLITQGASSLFSGLGGFGGSSSTSVSLSPSKMFASGGVVNGATAFPMASGTGIMGEAGAEAIMPLARGSDGKLGVQGGGGVVNQTIVVQAGVSQTVQSEMRRMMPDIRRLSEEAVRDAQQRGRM